MLRPLNKRLVARLVPEKEKTINGFIIPNSEPRKDIFEVIAITENEQGIKPNDKILIDKYDALEKEFDGEKYYIIQCERVLGVLDGN